MTPDDLDILDRLTRRVAIRDEMIATLRAMCSVPAEAEGGSRG